MARPSVPASLTGTADIDAADHRRAVQHHDGRAGLAGGLQKVRHGAFIRIESRPDILQIDQHRVQLVQVFCLGMPVFQLRPIQRKSPGSLVGLLSIALPIPDLSSTPRMPCSGENSMVSSIEGEPLPCCCASTSMLRRPRASRPVWLVNKPNLIVAGIFMWQRRATRESVGVLEHVDARCAWRGRAWALSTPRARAVAVASLPRNGVTGAPPRGCTAFASRMMLAVAARIHPHRRAGEARMPKAANRVTPRARGREKGRSRYPIQMPATPWPARAAQGGHINSSVACFRAEVAGTSGEPIQQRLREQRRVVRGENTPA